jgi:hypothetical protein
MVAMNLILAGADRAEVDYVGCQIMGYGLDEVRHLDYFVQANGIDLSAVEVVGVRIEDVRRDFKKVSLDAIVPEALRVHQRNACSACMNALYLSCQLLPSAPSERVDVYLGSIVEQADVAEGLRLAFGNCCPNDARFDARVAGCPPYPFTLGRRLQEMTDKR